jgi:type I restriction enzyme S subunit
MLEKGYKQTELGVIPEDWSVKRLGEIAGFQYGLGESGKKTGDYVYIRITDITPDGFLKKKGLVFVEKSKVSESYILKKGDVLIARTGASFGKTYLFRESFRATFGGFLIRFLFNNKFINNEFFFHFSRNNLFWKQANTLVGGGAQPQFNANAIADLMLPCPSLLEQASIAKVFSDIDDLIESLDKLIEKKKNIKQGAMQELITGKKRLPRFDEYSNDLSKQYQQTEFGKVPEDWKIIQLKNIVDPVKSIRYGIVQPGNFDPNGRYMIRGQDYSESKGWARPSEVFKVSDVVEKKYKNARVKTGDIIMTIVGYCGHVDIIPEWLDGANLTQTTARISIDDRKALNKFCKYQLESSFGKLQVATYLKGAAQPGLNCGDVENFVLALPSIPEQSAIAKVLSDMDSEIEELEQKRDKYRYLKIGMMQQLLTGRIRLKWQS